MSVRTRTKAGAKPETPHAWLAALGEALHMPYERAEAIREELAEHLRERVRDLELEGLDEAAAARVAVRELGDAVVVARRFRNAERTPIRRMLMNLAVIGIAGAALVTSVVAISGGVQPTGANRASVYQSEVHASWGESIAIKPVKVQEGNIGQVLKMLGEEAAGRTVIRWNALNEFGIESESTITIDAPTGDLASAVAMLNESLGHANSDASAIEYRVKDGVIEFGPRAMFDRRESALVCYDITDLIESGIDLGEVCGAITTFVDPENWRDNGGELGTMQIVGERMFVQAPPRMQEGVKWIIEQLAGRKTPAAARGEMPENDPAPEAAVSAK